MATPSQRDVVVAGLVGLAGFAVYLRTLYPGLVGTGDTPELQFVGHVFGTPHTPGYPLYMLVSWAFARLPFGNLAYRINLLSAVSAASAVALVFLLLRRLECRPAAAASVALAFGFGRLFWSQATLAEVYALAAALLLAVFLAVVAWGETRRDAALLAGIGLLALALGHHYSDVVTAAPALVLFVLWTDARSALRPRILAGGAALLALGLAQYGLVLLRTRQGAAYLGAHASTFGELVGVVRGGRFVGRLFAFDLRTVLLERLPSFGRLLLEEMTWAGLALLLAGLTVLVRRRPRHAALFALGVAGPAFLALNYDVPDIAVFLLPSLVLLWPLVGVGLEAVLSLLGRVPPGPALWALALTLPAAQLALNYRANDHHARSFEMRYFRAVLEALPDRAAIVWESYTVEQMLRYELLGEGFGERKRVALSGRDLESVQAYLRKGYAVFAFERGRQELAARGYRFAPLGFRDAPLPQYLRRLPARSLVLLAGCPPEPGPDLVAALDELGVPLRLGVSHACLAVAGIAGETGGAAEFGSGEAALDLAVGQALGETGRPMPVTLRLAASPGDARIVVKGRVVETAKAGLALAVLNAAGQVVERHTVEAGDGLWVPFNRRAFPFYRLTGTPSDAR